ncbi:MAG: hypothetical protein JXK16_12340 [Thiotrichales bacterium]|nr:hypothetical protein [Thiotrichales bacterium]
MNSEHQKNLEALMLDLLFKSNSQVTQDSANEASSVPGSIDELNAELKLRKALGRGTGLREDRSFDFEDNLLLQFYRLAHINDYKYVTNFFRNDPASPDFEITENLVFSSHPSLYGLKNILQHYAENQKMLLLDEGLDAGSLLRDIEERVIGVNLPMYHQLENMPNLIDYLGILFDTSLEMAVCSYTAHKLNHVGIAWNALMKSRELLGGYVGARSVAKNYVDKKMSGAKGPHIKRLRRDILREVVIKHINQVLIPDKKPGSSFPLLKENELKRKRKSERNALFHDLSEIFKQYYRQEIDRLYLDPNISELSTNSLVKMFENWMSYTDFRDAVDRYIDVSLGVIHKEEQKSKDKDSESNYVLKADVVALLENIYRTTNLHLSAYHQTCIKKKCPINRVREASTKKLKTYLKDPLFSPIKQAEAKRAKEAELPRTLTNVNLYPRSD